MLRRTSAFTYSLLLSQFIYFKISLHNYWIVIDLLKALPFSYLIASVLSRNPHVYYMVK